MITLVMWQAKTMNASGHAIITLLLYLRHCHFKYITAAFKKWSSPIDTWATEWQAIHYTMRHDTKPMSGRKIQGLQTAVERREIISLKSTSRRLQSQTKAQRSKQGWPSSRQTHWGNCPHLPSFLWSTISTLGLVRETWAWQTHLTANKGQPPCREWQEITSTNNQRSLGRREL